MNGLQSEGDQGLPRAIIARAREGDVVARQELARGHYDFVYRHVLAAAARSGSEVDADDITQSTFVRAFETLNSYSGEGSFEGWLLTIAMRTACDFYRRRRTAPSEVDLASNDSFDGLTQSRTPLEAALRLEENLRVRRALAQLSEDHRQVLACRIVSELSVRETARVMKRTEPAVQMLQLRAVRALADALARTGPKVGGEEA